MATTHILGYPRIGKQRELKFALESYWKGESDIQQLFDTSYQLRQQNWHDQRQLDWVSVGDFSFYDHVLDTSVLLGNLPRRIDPRLQPLDQYFQAARGRTNTLIDQTPTHAAEMTKWFDTNYHYLVPEFDKQTHFSLHADALLEQVKQAQENNLKAKPVLLGPVSYLYLGKSKDETDRLSLLDQILPCYEQLLNQLAAQGIEWVQIDEPILATELDRSWQQALELAYFSLNRAPVKILLCNYFGPLENNLHLACNLPTAGLHIDAVTGRDEVVRVIDWLPTHKVLSLGVIDGRNIWKTDLNAVLDWLEPLQQRLADRLWLATSCSLLHVPLDLSLETSLDADIKNWLAFARQKLDELNLLSQALTHGRQKIAQALNDNAKATASRQHSDKVHNHSVQQRIETVTDVFTQRQSPFSKRIKAQQQQLNLPVFPTTTIGSFPQTQAIRQSRLRFRKGELDSNDYQQQIKQHIQYAVEQQHQLDLDVLVHGEAERNDMVEYFGEQLQGFVFSRFGWVQSYGSRCVKPPIIYGDVSRPQAMTVDWTIYAQSLTEKPMKGMLTGPVTILNWSFVRDDQPLSATCLQIALAIRDEVLDLEQAGIQIIQIDEAALREGLPLRKTNWAEYLKWAVRCFKISANGVQDKTQIHTHMCYSEFNDIIDAIADMDADVITIETSRSDMELLDAFKAFDYPNEIGPGVYDIHSPNIPSVDAVRTLMEKAAQRIPSERLWVNPDCGLKTRNWEEVIPALQAMVEAAKQLRQQCKAA